GEEAARPVHVAELVDEPAQVQLPGLAGFERVDRGGVLLVEPEAPGAEGVRGGVGQAEGRDVAEHLDLRGRASGQGVRVGRAGLGGLLLAEELAAGERDDAETQGGGEDDDPCSAVFRHALSSTTWAARATTRRPPPSPSPRGPRVSTPAAWPRTSSPATARGAWTPASAPSCRSSTPRSSRPAWRVIRTLRCASSPGATAARSASPRPCS